MNKTAIKNFAIWARNKLIADISYRAGLMGITAEGIHAALPQSTGQTEFYDIGTAEPYAITGTAIRQRRHLAELIQRKEKDTDYKTAYKYIIEEVAYTWFNRLIAVRFMEVNDYLPSHIRVLSSESGKMEPDLVTIPFDADLEFTNAEQQIVLELKNANKLDEVFRLLFIKQCNALNDILPALFEKTNDYTELLLNLSVIDQDGVVYHLVHDIPEEDFDVERGGQVEIIGWLYQYYNTEPKNEAFAKKGKITKEEVPAVTQLFTPDWIVRYMVENSLGRLWVEGHPNDDLKAGWKYYLEEAEQEPEVQAQLAEIRVEYTKLNPEDIKIIDPCMGSGHILVYAFDVLMQIYESAGYGQRDAAKSILENNLYGLDIDDRAFQMAYFAVMMKARQYNRRIFNSEYQPNLYSIRESNEINREHLKYFGRNLTEKEKDEANYQMISLLDTFKDAKEYGSLIELGDYNWQMLMSFVEQNDFTSQLSFETIGLDNTKESLNRIIAIAKALQSKYSVVVTNPPYMSSSNANNVLSGYLGNHYLEGKSDLFAAFMQKVCSLTKQYGISAMITQHAWMFLSGYSDLRRILYEGDFINMLHLGARAFDEIGGEVVQTTTFSWRNSNIDSYIASYKNLTQGKNESEKQELFLSDSTYYCKKEAFEYYPGRLLAYWLNERIGNLFRKETRLGDIATPRQGLSTSDNDRFLRLWFEVDINKIGFGLESREASKRSHRKWFPYNKGGKYRKWYGNREYILNWENDGEELRAWADWLNTHRTPMGRLVSKEFYFRDSLTWSKVSTTGFAVRFLEQGFLFDVSGTSIFVDAKYKKYLLGALNSCINVPLIKSISPTMNFESGQIANFPVVYSDEKLPEINVLVGDNIEIMKLDWNIDETSWDYKHNSLLEGENMGHLIADKYKEWKNECEDRFQRLKNNEQELNRIFIEIYGLQGELSPDVKDKDITLRKAELQRDIKSFLSYAVGCMFGRYSLDVDGLAFAGGAWNSSNYISFIPDEDNIIPITDEEYLEDDIVTRLCEWLKGIYGIDTLEENLEFIASALSIKGKSSREIIRNYFLNNFFKDHCQMYSVTGSGKRPIYWLFDSGKQNGFKALIYLHRYNVNTIGNLRIDYLHRLQRIYESEISRMQDVIDNSTSTREVVQATKRREKLQRQLKECHNYDEKLAHLALSRIELNLDDGVKVNYRKIQTANDGKIYEVLADSKAIMAKEK